MLLLGSEDENLAAAQDMNGIMEKQYAEQQYQNDLQVRSLVLHSALHITDQNVYCKAYDSHKSFLKDMVTMADEPEDKKEAIKAYKEYCMDEAKKPKRRCVASAEPNGQ